MRTKLSIVMCQWILACMILTMALTMQDAFGRMIVDAGFQKVEYENLVGGVVAIHSGLKL